MAATPRDSQPQSLLYSPSPARGGGAEATFGIQRQPSTWTQPAATPATPVSRFLQPLQAQRSDGPAARYRDAAHTPTECPPIPMASSLFSVRGVACSRGSREEAELVHRRT